MRTASDKAPHLPLAGTSLASASNEKVQVDLVRQDNLIAPHAMDLFRRRSMLVLVTPKNPLGRWDASAASRTTVFGEPRRLQMDSGA